MAERVRVGVVGGGKLGGGIVQGLTERGVVQPSDITVCESVPARRDYLQEHYHVVVTDEYAPALNGVDASLLVLRPQDFNRVASEMRPWLPRDPLLISVMAGVRMESIQVALPSARAVRVMPNLGATVGESFSTWIATSAVSPEDRALVRTLLGAVGHEQEVDDERYLDMATAVAGSGPGFVMLMLEALIDGGVHIGLPRTLATAMATQTMYGALRWAQEDPRHPAELRAQVVSPGGTTAAGVLALERGGVRVAIVDAVIAAYERSRALGG